MEKKSKTDDAMQKGTYSETLLIKTRKTKNCVEKDEIQLDVSATLKPLLWQCGMAQWSNNRHC